MKSATPGAKCTDRRISEGVAGAAVVAVPGEEAVAVAADADGFAVAASPPTIVSGAADFWEKAGKETSATLRALTAAFI